MVLLLQGCAQKPSAKAEGSLSFSLDAESSRAGEEVGYLVEVIRTDGTHESVFATVTSTLEPDLDVQADVLRATVAGSHTLTATADVDGSAATAEAALAVTAGPANTLDLVLGNDTTSPELPVTWTLTGTDAWNNPVDVAAADLDGGDALAVDDTTASGTVAGVWPLVARLDDASDEASLTITAGPPALIDISLSDVSVNVTTRQAQVRADLDSLEDAWGNAVDADYSVSSDGALAYVGHTVFYDTEGWYSITATVDGTAVSDTEGPFLVDLNPPLLTVETPVHGAWGPEGTTRVTGTAADASAGVDTVEVNGVAADVADGRWTADVPTPFGMTIFETTAVDGVGLDATDLRAQLSGEVAAVGEPVDAGLMVRLKEGAGGLDAIADSLGEPVDEATLLAALPSPLYEGSDSTCFGPVCIDYSVSLSITDLRWASSTVTLDPQADGTLVVELTLDDVEADWTASGEAASRAYADSGTGTATSITIAVTVDFGVVDGAVTVEVRDTATTVTGLDMNVSASVDTVLGVLGIDPESELEDALDTGLADTPEAVASAIETSFADLSVDNRWDLGETTATLTAVPTQVAVDADGITLSMATTLDLDTWVIDRAPHGSLVHGYAAPTWSGTGGAQMAFSADFVTQIFYGAWGAGAFDLELTDEQMSVDMTSFSVFFPGLADLVMTTDPLLPPVVVPDGDGAFSFDIGDYLTRLYEAEAVDGAELYRVYLDTRTPMTFDVADGALTTSLGTAAVQAHVDLAEPEADVDLIEGKVNLLAPSLDLDDNRYIGEITLPDLAGFTLVTSGVTAEGAEGGYVVVAGDLAAD